MQTSEAAGVQEVVFVALTKDRDAWPAPPTAEHSMFAVVCARTAFLLLPVPSPAADDCESTSTAWFCFSCVLPRGIRMATGFDPKSLHSTAELVCFVHESARPTLSGRGGDDPAQAQKGSAIEQESALRRTIVPSDEELWDRALGLRPALAKETYMPLGEEHRLTHPCLRKHRAVVSILILDEETMTENTSGLDFYQASTFSPHANKEVVRGALGSFK